MRMKTVLWTIVVLVGFCHVGGGEIGQISESRAACVEYQAEHPTLTNWDGTIAVCGSQYGLDKAVNGCAAGYHLCRLDEFDGHYDLGKDPKGAKTSYGQDQSPRCGSCVQSSFYPNYPCDTNVFCGNVYNQTTKQFLPLQPKSMSSPQNLGHGIVKNRSVDDEDSWLWAPPNEWPVDWAPYPPDPTYISVYCCASEGSAGTQGCKVFGAEHPSYTSKTRDAVLCGGTYTRNAADACAADWHVCSLVEWNRVYSSGVWPGGLISSWGAEQLDRACPCPFKEGAMWSPAVPTNSDFYCGDICGTSQLLYGDGVVLQYENGSMGMFPREDVEKNWFRKVALRVVEGDMSVGSLCCIDSFPDYNRKKDLDFPWWGVAIVLGATFALVVVIFVLSIFTCWSAGGFRKIWNFVLRKKTARLEGYEPLNDGDAPVDLDRRDESTPAYDDGDVSGLSEPAM